MNSRVTVPVNRSIDLGSSLLRRRRRFLGQAASAPASGGDGGGGAATVDGGESYVFVCLISAHPLIGYG